MQHMPVEVLYEDNHLIAVYKPAGILVQEDISREKSLMDDVKEYIKEKYKKEGNVFLGLIHRLDRNVSGIVLFAKTSKGASRLSEQFREHTVQKIYHAWVVGTPSLPMASLKHYLVKDEEKNKTHVHDTVALHSQHAELSYEIVKKEEGYTLLKIELQTGRSHQIRAQLAHIGCPIVGDLKYGAPFALADQSLLLCATSLAFKTATTNEEKLITISLPELVTT